MVHPKLAFKACRFLQKIHDSDFCGIFSGKPFNDAGILVGFIKVIILYTVDFYIHLASGGDHCLRDSFVYVCVCSYAEGIEL